MCKSSFLVGTDNGLTGPCVILLDCRSLEVKKKEKKYTIVESTQHDRSIGDRLREGGLSSFAALVDMLLPH